jgi:hypothetical protein
MHGDMLVFVLFGLLGACAFLLGRIAAHLEAIRTILADIAKATSNTAAGSTSYLPRIMSSTDKTEKLLERAVKKQWGSAIDSVDAR